MGLFEMPLSRCTGVKSLILFTPFLLFSKSPALLHTLLSGKHSDLNGGATIGWIAGLPTNL